MSALTIKKLCKSFGGLHVTTNVDLNVAPGERRLIIGPNGAGKTTLFNLITGELTPDSGSIELFGQDITHVPSRRRAHLGMARTYQIITLFARDTLEQGGIERAQLPLYMNVVRLFFALAWTVGPALGAVVAALTYELLFLREPIAKPGPRETGLVEPGVDI